MFDTLATSLGYTYLCFLQKDCHKWDSEVLSFNSKVGSVFPVFTTALLHAGVQEAVFRTLQILHRLHHLSPAKYCNGCKDILVLRVITNVLPKVLISYVIRQNVIKYVRSIGMTALVHISMGASQISIVISEHFPLCLYLYTIFNFLCFHTK